MAADRKRAAALKPVAGGGSAVLHEEVYARLSRAIIAGQVEPGRSLSVRGLAAEFGVSAMPAREAIKRLAALGAVELTPTRRITIARMTPARFDEIAIARQALEPPLAAKVVSRRSDDRALNALAAKLSKIDLRLDKAIAAGDAAAYGKHNSEFHFALYEAAEAPVLLSLVESLWLQIGPFMRIVIGRLGTSSLVDQHKEAIMALERRDADALKEAISKDIAEGMNAIARSVIEDPVSADHQARKRARR